MRCGTARRLLWPGSGPQAITATVEQAEAHLGTCEACRRFLTDQGALAAELRRLADRHVAPTAVRERVFDGLARERVGQSARSERTLRTATAGLTMLVAGLLVAGSLWVTRSRPDDPNWQQQLVAVAEDHVRTTHGESVASSDVAIVQRWLTGRVPFAVHIPMMPDAALQGARLCYMDGRRGVVLRYQVDNREVSYYLVPAESSNAAPLARERFLQGAQSGYQVVAWHDVGLIHALVGDLPDDRLLQLARYCVDRSTAKEKSALNIASIPARTFGVLDR